jgi:hypothetical protein
MGHTVVGRLLLGHTVRGKGLGGADRSLSGQRRMTRQPVIGSDPTQDLKPSQPVMCGFLTLAPGSRRVILRSLGGALQRQSMNDRWS